MTIFTRGVLIHTRTPILGDSLIYIFTHIASPVILITNGLEERDLGMVMVFCHTNQAKIEACDALFQWNTSEPSVVVVRRYSNAPYIPWGTSHSLYLDRSTLSGGASSAQFPLYQPCLHQLIPFSRTEGCYTWRGGREAGNVSPSSRDPVHEFRGGTHLSDPISLLVPTLALFHIWKMAPRWRYGQAII